MANAQVNELMRVLKHLPFTPEHNLEFARRLVDHGYWSLGALETLTLAKLMDMGFKPLFAKRILEVVHNPRFTIPANLHLDELPIVVPPKQMLLASWVSGKILPPSSTAANGASSAAAT